MYDLPVGEYRRKRSTGMLCHLHENQWEGTHQEIGARFRTSSVRLELWIKDGMISMNSGCPPVSTICRNSTMKVFSETFYCLD